MRIVIAGGSGFIGTALTKFLAHNGHEIFVLTRGAKSSNSDTISYVKWLGKEDKPEKELHNIDAIINLAGESINSGRWNQERKHRILQSRLNATKEIKKLIHHLTEKPNVFLNASAVGYYGTSTDKKFTEKTTATGKDFLAQTTYEWEKEAASIGETFGIRTVFTRFGVVLDKTKGALPQIANPYHYFIGGKVGSGEQWISWVHLEDAVRLLMFALENEIIEGPLNITAPSPVKMDTFGQVLGKALHRPHWLPAPAFALKMLLGEMSLLVLEGQYVEPEKALDNGFTFLYPTVEGALEKIYNT